MNNKKTFIYKLREYHGKIHEWRVNILPRYLERVRNPQAVYLVFTPEHGNLGDHAIAQSETEILLNLKIPYIEITGKQLFDLEKKKMLKVMNGRVILIHGGGYLGTIWLKSELMIRSIIINNPKSTVFLLPNTIYYEDDEKGKTELGKSIEIYNSHRKLKIFAREKISYEKMKKIYQNVSLVPDMVLHMNKCQDGIERKGCILCLRNDCEKTRTVEKEKSIRRQLKKIFGENVRELDMVVSHQIPVCERNKELETQYDALRHSELVVTDRLHGMIFCVITGTPCIVIDSKSPKVRGCYDWIRDLPYICFCENVDELTHVFESIPRQKWKYDNKKLLPFYEPLKHDILMAAKGKFHAIH